MTSYLKIYIYLYTNFFRAAFYPFVTRGATLQEFSLKQKFTRKTQKSFFYLSPATTYKLSLGKQLISTMFAEVI